jgi:hypothetical protein
VPAYGTRPFLVLDLKEDASATSIVTHSVDARLRSHHYLGLCPRAASAAGWFFFTDSKTRGAREHPGTTAIINRRTRRDAATTTGQMTPHHPSGFELRSA